MSPTSWWSHQTKAHFAALEIVRVRACMPGLDRFEGMSDYTQYTLAFVPVISRWP